MEPPGPEREIPVPMCTVPDIPEEAVPVDMTIEPLTPVVPEFNVRIAISPLLELNPRPVFRLMLPPVRIVETPASIITLPPMPLSPLPTVR
jgi:hypothetical protein